MVADPQTSPARPKPDLLAQGIAGTIETGESTSNASMNAGLTGSSGVTKVVPLNDRVSGTIQVQSRRQRIQKRIKEQWALLREKMTR